MSDWTLTPNAGTVTAGQGLSFVAHPNSGVGLCESITVSGLPTGGTYSVSNTNSIGPCSAGFYYNVGANDAVITISTTTSTPSGTYSLSVSGSIHPNAATFSLTVQGGSGGGGGGNTGSGGTASVNIGTIASGSGIIVGYTSTHNGGVAPTDSQGNTYAFRSGGTLTGSGEFTYWYDSLNVTGGSNLTISVTNSALGIAAQSYSGIAGADTFGTWSNGSNTSPSITPTHKQLILVGMGLGAFTVNSAGSTPNSGWVNTATDGANIALYGNTVSTSGTWKVQNGGGSSTAVGVGSYWSPAPWTLAATGTQQANQSNATPGSSATYSISTTSLDNVTLSYVSGLPTGGGQSFSPNPIASGTSSTFTVTTSAATTPAGVYTINLSATDGNTTTTFSVVLQVLGVWQQSGRWAGVR